MGGARARRRWPWILLALSGVALLGLGLGLVVRHREQERERVRVQAIAECEALGQSITSVWNEEVHARVARQSELAAEQPMKAARWAAVTERVAEHAASWAEQRTRLCVEDRVEARHVASYVDEASACLDEARVELETLVEVWTGFTRTPVDELPDLLLSPEACLDPSWLARRPTPPAKLRAEVDELRRSLAAVRATRLGGDRKSVV